MKTGSPQDRLIQQRRLLLAAISLVFSGPLAASLPSKVVPAIAFSSAIDNGEIVDDSWTENDDGSITLEYKHIKSYIEYYQYTASVGSAMDASSGAKDEQCRLEPGYASDFKDNALDPDSLAIYCVPTNQTYFIATAPYAEVGSAQPIELSAGVLFEYNGISDDVVNKWELGAPSASFCDGSTDDCTFFVSSGRLVGVSASVTDRYGRGVDFLSGDIGLANDCLGFFLATVCW